MEKRNKRNRNKRRNEEITKTEDNQTQIENEKQIDENSDKFILKKYMDADMEKLNPAELKRMKPFIEEIRTTIKIFKTENFENLAKITENHVIINSFTI